MSFTAAQIAHLEQNHNTFEAVTLLELQFRDETVRVSDSPVPLTIGGNVYQGLEGVLSASGVSREGGFKASAVTYKLHSLTGPLVAAVDTDRAQYLDREAIRSVQLYADGIAVGDPIVIHRGFMNSARWRKSHNEDFVEVTVRDLFSGRLASPDYYTDAHQRSLYPDDKAFQYVASFEKQTNLSGWLF